jgi:hypothetical protein
MQRFLLAMLKTRKERTQRRKKDIHTTCTQYVDRREDSWLEGKRKFECVRVHVKCIQGDVLTACGHSHSKQGEKKERYKIEKYYHTSQQHQSVKTKCIRLSVGEIVTYYRVYFSQTARATQTQTRNTD